LKSKCITSGERSKRQSLLSINLLRSRRFKEAKRKRRAMMMKIQMMGIIDLAGQSSKRRDCQNLKNL
jgi:hypothetical protein